MGIVISFLLGATASSVVWFFVWRNNKNKFKSALDKIDNLFPGQDDN